MLYRYSRYGCWILKHWSEVHIPYTHHAFTIASVCWRNLNSMWLLVDHRREFQYVAVQDKRTVHPVVCWHLDSWYSISWLLGFTTIETSKVWCAYQVRLYFLITLFMSWTAFTSDQTPISTITRGHLKPQSSAFDSVLCQQRTDTRQSDRSTRIVGQEAPKQG